MDAPERIWAVPSLGGDWNDDLGMWWNEDTGIEPQAEYRRADLCADPALLSEAVEVLRWYGEQSRLARLIHSEGDTGRQAIADDGGKRARAFLAKLENCHDR